MAMRSRKAGHYIDAAARDKSVCGSACPRASKSSRRAEGADKCWRAGVDFDDENPTLLRYWTARAVVRRAKPASGTDAEAGRAIEWATGRRLFLQFAFLRITGAREHKPTDERSDVSHDVRG